MEILGRSVCICGKRKKVFFQVEDDVQVTRREGGKRWAKGKRPQVNWQKWEKNTSEVGTGGWKIQCSRNHLGDSVLELRFRGRPEEVYVTSSLVSASYKTVNPSTLHHPYLWLYFCFPQFFHFSQSGTLSLDLIKEGNPHTFERF